MRTWRFVLVLVFALGVAAAGGCGDDQPDPSPRTVDVGSLTIEDIRLRAVAAVRRPGEVFHLTTLSPAGQGNDTQVWIDVQRELARSNEGDTISVWYDGRHATTISGRFSDAPFSATGLEPPSLFALAYMAWLFDDEIKERKIEEGSVNGGPATVVEIRRKLYDYDADETARIYLDESFLPLRFDRDDTRRGVSKVSFSYEYEFVPASSLAPDFFSREVVRAQARTPEDDLADARDAGFDPYWLGATFENVVLRDESGVSMSPGGTREDVIRLSYGPANPSVPSPCVQLFQYGRDAWAERQQQGNDEPQGVQAVATTTIPGGQATIYQGLVTPPPGPTVSGGAPPPPLPVVPEDTGANREAIVLLDSGGAIEVRANCGPAGSNVYRTATGFDRVIAALRPYEQD